MHTEAERGYLAGIVDGEGAVTIGSQGSGQRTLRHSLVVVVTNTHLGVLDYLANLWDGTLTTPRERREGWKRAGDVRWFGLRAAALLMEIRPYLIIKREQCDIALQFAATINDAAHSTRPISPETWEYRETLRIQLGGLNTKRGALPQQTYPEKPVLTCQFCGKEFSTYQRTRKYCSSQCNSNAHRDAYYLKHQREQTCPACGETFTTYRKNQVYCSPKCAAQQRVHIKQCVECGRSYHPSTSRQQTCSLPCGVAYRSKRRKAQRIVSE